MCDLVELVSETRNTLSQTATCPRTEIIQRLMAVRAGLTVAGVVCDMLEMFRISTARLHVGVYSITAECAHTAVTHLDPLFDEDVLAEYCEGTPVGELTTLVMADRLDIEPTADITSFDRVEEELLNLGAAIRDLAMQVINEPMLTVLEPNPATVASEAGELIRTIPG